MIMKINGRAKRKGGFTLVEIMIVVVIIGILAALAVPAFQRARWNAVETSVRNNLRQIWGAAQQYMMEKGVATCEVSEVVLYEAEKGKTPSGTNPGYTGIIKIIVDEDYSTLVCTAPGATPAPAAGEIFDTATSLAVDVSGPGEVTKTVTLNI